MIVDNATGKEVTRLLQYLTMVLMSMYGHRDLVRKATVQVWLFSCHFYQYDLFHLQVVHDLVNVILLILLEPSVPDLPEGGQLVRLVTMTRSDSGSKFFLQSSEGVDSEDCGQK